MKSLKIIGYLESQTLSKQHHDSLLRKYGDENIKALIDLSLSELERICWPALNFLKTEENPSIMNFPNDELFESYYDYGIKILRNNSSLFNDNFVDDAISDILFEGQEVVYMGQIERCIELINQNITNLYFDFLYDQVQEMNDITEIDRHIELTKEDTNRIYFKPKNRKAFSIENKSLHNELSEHLIKSLEHRKEKLFSRINSKPVLPRDYLSQLNLLFGGLIWDTGIEEEEFWRYWSFGYTNKLINKIKSTKQNSFVFLLFKIGLIDEDKKPEYTKIQIADLFGINNIYKVKSDVLKRHRKSGKMNNDYSEIERILKSMKK